MTKIFYNRNVAAKSRGRDNDVPSETKEFESLAHLIAWLSGRGLFWCDAFEDESVSGDDMENPEFIQGLLYYGEIDIEDVVQAANSVDISGGDAVIFSIEVDGNVYKTTWNPRDWEEAEYGIY